MKAKAKPYVVVVGVDYSETGDLALAHGLEIASTSPNAELHAVHVASSSRALSGLEHVPDPLDAVPKPAHVAKAFEAYVDKKLRDFTTQREPRSPLPERVVTHLRIDAPAEEIAALARELDAHLVIVGTHGRRGLSRVFLGSVAEGVVRLAPCPVLVVRPRELSAVPRIEPPCEHCVRARIATGGRRQWCNQHMERHGARHTYHQGDRMASDGGMPLVFRG